ncbi:MAG: hypothetical protein GY839_20515, partial [candidate division Zixibacteria bacterium]|nr:hypothetical protein [candidate division Zixibacteria bacterium]
MKKIAFLFLCFVVLVSFDTQANESDYGIKTIRVHPKVIKPGTEVTVNVLVTGDFTRGNPVVGIYINDEKVIDNREIAESPVSLAPTVSLKFTADNRFLSRDLELKAVMSFEDQRYEILYPNSANKDFCADAPWRVVGEDAAIPVEASIFDGDQWECNLDWIDISDVNNGGAEVAYYDGGGESIDDHRWSYLFDNLIASDFVIVDGYIEMVVQMHYRELIIVPYDFYQYLRVKVADRNFPRIAGWYYGDTHYHSAFTDNFNERGGSFAMIGRCGPAIGLHWTMITDHASNNSGNQWPVGDFANDLEDHEWNALWDSCQAYRTSDFRIIRGEEVTVKNDATTGGDDGTNDNTAHMLTLANSNYIEGPIGPEAYPESGNHSNLKPLTSRLQLLDPMQYGIAYSAHPEDAWIVEVFE